MRRDRRTGPRLQRLGGRVRRRAAAHGGRAGPRRRRRPPHPVPGAPGGGAGPVGARRAALQLPLHRPGRQAPRSAGRPGADGVGGRERPRGRRWGPSGSSPAASPWGAASRRRRRRRARPRTASCSWATRCTRPASRSSLRDRHLPAIKAPMLFVQGTRDAFARWDLLTAVLAPPGTRRDTARVDGGGPLVRRAQADRPRREGGGGGDPPRGARVARRARAVAATRVLSSRAPRNDTLGVWGQRPRSGRQAPSAARRDSLPARIA